LIKTQATENVLTPSSFLPLKYDLLLGPNNRVSRHTQWLVGKELEAVNHPPIKTKIFEMDKLFFILGNSRF